MRSIIYSADLQRFREVTLLLFKDCCGGFRELTPYKSEDRMLGGLPPKEPGLISRPDPISSLWYPSSPRRLISLELFDQELPDLPSP